MSKNYEEIQKIIWRIRNTGYVMSKFLTKDDLYKKMREDINTLCVYIESHKET